jgi:hypothetical protein
VDFDGFKSSDASSQTDVDVKLNDTLTFSMAAVKYRREKGKINNFAKK